MRKLGIVFLSAGLLTLTSAHAMTTQGDVATVASATTQRVGVIRLAGSFHNAPNKLGDKMLSGAAGGFYGIGGNEPRAKYFKSRMKKIPRCCSSSH